MKLILFDFDGTLTTRDSFISFVRFSTTSQKFYFLLLKFFFKLVLFKLGFYKGGSLKKEILAYLFKNFSEEKMKKIGKDYATQIIPSLIQKNIMEQLIQYKEEGDKVCIVSASLDVWLKPFCNDLMVDCICTELKYLDQKFSGDFSTPNCNFEEKKNRVMEIYNVKKYNEVIVYGNSKGDRSLFELADVKFKV
jgi:HAD superfamily hydrolase (TIGR01490 family)